MKYTLDYLLESFPRAVRHLVTGEGDARKRLWSAYVAIRHFQPEHMPEYLREDFEWVSRQVRKRDPERQDVVSGSTIHEEGLIQANIRTMQNRTASKIADRIYTMYEKILGMACEPRPGVCLPFPKGPR